MRKFRRRLSRRSPRVAWFTPRTDGTAMDPTVSCWSDTDATFFPETSVSLPTIMISPIVTNVAQAELPGNDPTLNAHPLSEKWTIQRIVGSIHFNAEPFGTIGNPPVNAADIIIGSVLLHMGIVRMATVGDAFPIPRPSHNDSALSDWMWLHHQEMSTANIVCHTCHYQVLKPSDSTVVDGLEIQGPVSSAEVFGLPSLLDIPVNVKVKRRIEPEHGLWLVCTATVQPGFENNIAIAMRPFLRAIISKTV